jgi:hypothetical protein
MKRIALLFIIIIHISLNGFAQNKSLPYSGQHGKNVNTDWQSLNLDLTLGYIPKPSAQGLKTSFALNNILFHRLGLYTSFEYAFDSGAFFNTVGGTFTVNKIIYFYGAADLFTKNGLLAVQSFGFRKELGIGITPYKGAVVQIGGSSSVGLTFSVGYRIPL